MYQRLKQDARVRSRRTTAGFSLVEVMAVVVIIAIISAIALPNLRGGLRDRRTRLAAEDVARVYRDARLRAMGRGSAVVVRYNASTASFQVREAVMGTSSSTPATCARLPATSCQLASWNQEPTTLRGSQALETYQLDTSTASGLKVSFLQPVTTSTTTTTGTTTTTTTTTTPTEQSEFSVCYTPLGRAFYSTSWPPTFSAEVPLTAVPLVNVWRVISGTTTQDGLMRRVVILPNGQARIQTPGSST